MAGLLSGDTRFTFSTLPAAVPLVQEGRLRALAVDHPVIADVRGPGLMVAAEFRDPATGAPDEIFDAGQSYGVRKGQPLDGGGRGSDQIHV